MPKSYLYFLLNKGECVYIGRTTQGLARLHRHRHMGKCFDDYFIVQVPADQAAEMERFYIETWKPPLNKMYAR